MSFGRFLRLNFSGSGVSLGVGPRGLNVNIGPRGVRKTVGLPGSGISYQTFTAWPKNPPPPSSTERSADTLPELRSMAGAGYSPSPVPAQPEGEKSGVWIKVLLIAMLCLGGYLAFRPAVTPPPMAVVESQPEPVKITTPGRPSPVQTPSSVAPMAPSNVPTAPPASAAPIDVSPLTLDEVREVQTWLKAFGLDPGPIDGLAGPLTTAAIKRYESARQRSPTGTLDRRLLELLRHDGGKIIVR